MTATGRLEAGLIAGVRVRRACADDRAALEAMFLRCTPATIYRRFHGPVKAFPASYLTEALAGVPVHLGLVAVSGSASGPAGGGLDGGARVVALASCRLTDSSSAAELGVLVEDGWQGRGIGRELLRLLVEYADGGQIPELHAQVLIEQDWILGMLRPYGQCSSVFRPGVREVRVQLRPRVDPSHAAGSAGCSGLGGLVVSRRASGTGRNDPVNE